MSNGTPIHIEIAAHAPTPENTDTAQEALHREVQMRQKAMGQTQELLTWLGAIRESRRAQGAA